MNQKDEKIVMYNSPEAASVSEKTLNGWWSRHGRFYGFKPQAEHLARYDGCTHRPCEKCGSLAEKPWLSCQACRADAKVERYRAREHRPWDGATMLYSDSDDRYFADLDEAEIYADAAGETLEGLRLLICEPIMAREIEPLDYYSDSLPDFDGGDDLLPDEIKAAFEELNQAIRECKTPLSFMPGKYAVDLLDRQESSC